MEWREKVRVQNEGRAQSSKTAGKDCAGTLMAEIW